MDHPTALHQLGRFIFLFQHAEAALTDLLTLLSDADDEFIRILVNELEYSKRVKTTGVLFARFLDIRRGTYDAEKREFRELMSELLKLGERRNEIVHSKYYMWTDVDGEAGLLRQNSVLRASKGIREETEEELLPKAFELDCGRVSMALQSLERFRLKIIDWVHPDGPA